LTVLRVKELIGPITHASLATQPPQQDLLGLHTRELSDLRD